MDEAVDIKVSIWQRRQKTVVTMLLSAVAAIIGSVLWLRVPEPVHNGVRLGELLEAKGSAVNLHQDGKAMVIALGPKAVRYLTNVLENEPPPTQRTWAKIYPRVPSWLRKNVPAPKNYSMRRARAAVLLGWSPHPDAVNAVPLLCRVAREDDFFGTRNNAMVALSILGPQSKDAEMAIDAIIKGTSDSEPEVRKHAYGFLGAFTNHLEKVVTVLLPALRVPDYRAVSLNSLKTLGTNAMPVVRAKVTVEGYLPMSFEELEKELAKGADW